MTVTDAIVNNVRVMEDTLWFIVFVLIIVVAVKYSEASFGKVRTGYLTFIATGVSGFLWKGLGLVSRLFELKEPELVFDVSREFFEGTTGALFTIACILLAQSLYTLYAQGKKAQGVNKIEVGELNESV